MPFEGFGDFSIELNVQAGCTINNYFLFVEFSMSTIGLIASGYTDTNQQGVYRVDYDSVVNTFGKPEVVVASLNPSIGLKGANLWYFVEESEPGKIHIYDPNAQWQNKASIYSHGASPCHLALSASNTHLAVANYMGGNIAVFALDATGIPCEPPFILQHYGRGITERQEAPHAHFVTFANDIQNRVGIFAVDLGLDQIVWYPQRGDNSWGAGQVVLQAPPGDGPRHMAIHPSNGKIYVLNELSNILSVHAAAPDGSWLTLQRLSTLPEHFIGGNTAAHIVISQNGQFIYTSNRGHNSIAVFKITTDGLVELIQIEPCGGEGPRYFSLLEECARLVVAHEQTHSLAALAIAQDGRLSDTQARCLVPRPTFVAAAEV